ncbi:hypothetical protein D3C71_661420 [compost metagenome]
MLDSVDVRLDNLPELADVELQHHFVAGLRSHVGGQEGTRVIAPDVIGQPAFNRRAQFFFQRKGG